MKTIMRSNSVPIQRSNSVSFIRSCLIGRYSFRSRCFFFGLLWAETTISIQSSCLKNGTGAG